MKTTGVSGIPKFGLLDFLGHPIDNPCFKSVIIINTVVKMMNHNEPIVKACGDANRTATKKGPRGTNNNLIINNINVSLRKLRFKSIIVNVSLRKLLKKVATALEEKQRLIEEILQLPHQVDNSFSNIIRMIMFFFIFI